MSWLNTALAFPFSRWRNFAITVNVAAGTALTYKMFRDSQIAKNPPPAPRPRLFQPLKPQSDLIPRYLGCSPEEAIKVSERLRAGLQPASLSKWAGEDPVWIEGVTDRLLGLGVQLIRLFSPEQAEKAAEGLGAERDVLGAKIKQIMLNHVGKWGVLQPMNIERLLADFSRFEGQPPVAKPEAGYFGSWGASLITTLMAPFRGKFTSELANTPFAEYGNTIWDTLIALLDTQTSQPLFQRIFEQKSSPTDIPAAVRWHLWENRDNAQLLEIKLLGTFKTALRALYTTDLPKEAKDVLPHLLELARTNLVHHQVGGVGKK